MNSAAKCASNSCYSHKFSFCVKRYPVLARIASYRSQLLKKTKDITELFHHNIIFLNIIGIKIIQD